VAFDSNWTQPSRDAKSSFEDMALFDQQREVWCLSTCEISTTLGMLPPDQCADKCLPKLVENLLALRSKLVRLLVAKNLISLKAYEWVLKEN